MKRRLSDRRRRPRFEIVGELWGTFATIDSVSLLNIGRGGALVRSAMPAAGSSVHRMTVRCGEEDSVESVQVRHVRQIVGSDGQDYFLVGLEFLTLSPALAARIDEWVMADPSSLPETT